MTRRAGPAVPIQLLSLRTDCGTDLNSAVDSNAEPVSCQLWALVVWVSSYSEGLVNFESEKSVGS